MTDLEKEVAIALREAFCITGQRAFRMVCVDPNKVAEVAVAAVRQFFVDKDIYLDGDVWSQLY